MAHTKTDDSYVTDENIELKQDKETERKAEKADYMLEALGNAALTTISMQIINLGLGSAVNYYNNKQLVPHAVLIKHSTRIFISKATRDYIELKYIKDVCTEDDGIFCITKDSWVAIGFRATVGFLAGVISTIIAFANPNELTPLLSSSEVLFLNGLNTLYYDCIDAIKKSKLLGGTIDMAYQTKGLVAETFDALIKADSYIGKISGVLKGILYDNVAPHIKSFLIDAGNYVFANSEETSTQSSPTGEVNDNLAVDEL